MTLFNVMNKKESLILPHLPSNKPSFFIEQFEVRARAKNGNDVKRRTRKPLPVRFLHIFLLPDVRSPCIENFIFGIL